VIERADGEGTGAGLVLLSSRQQRLMLALIPNVEGADPDAELDPCTVQYELELLPEEHVLQVRVCNMY
jgi:hypothetical protein